VVNRADYDAMNRTVAFLTDQCCTGVRRSPNQMAGDDAA